jgi:GNAT superfamily N-acetyltransferase
MPSFTAYYWNLEFHHSNFILWICIFVFQIENPSPDSSGNPFAFFFTKQKIGTNSGFKLLKMNIRKGQKEDMPAVLSLIQELATFEKEPDAVVVTVADLERDGFGENPLFYTFVAEIDKEIVGMALYYYRYSTWKGRTIHLEDLIVNEKMRGFGLGYQLYAAVIEQGKIDQVRRIEWAVLDWNTPAIDFYLKSGAKVLNDWRVAQMDEQGINNFGK